MDRDSQTRPDGIPGSPLSLNPESNPGKGPYDALPAAGPSYGQSFLNQLLDRALADGRRGPVLVKLPE